MRTRVKICGITRAEDAQAAARLGADAIGLVFFDPSPRAVSIEQARAAIRVLPPLMSVVGLFVDASAERVREVLDGVRIDLLQFHGAEAPAYCASFGVPYIKAVRMREDVDVAAEARRYSDARGSAARGLLLDTYSATTAGGTGTAFDWRRVPREAELPLILAGGLTPDNVAQAVRQVRPYAVDVSGGVEAAKGVKDAAKMAQFIEEVNIGDRTG
ncbi:phosphoribosylanthranilate isomerase [Ectothiorhodospiraceae bacterium 2226]|nr:phosphoribosylanthranilate isomerase [Ectothiorhodospiraceae bacterium 2226]